jgi:hypothetical protein
VHVGELGDALRRLGFHRERRWRGSEQYADYANWARTSGYMPVSQKRLTRQLGDRGYQLDPGKRSILGLALKHSSIGRVRSMTRGSASGDDPVANIIDWPGKRRPMPDGGVAAARAPDEVDVW